MQMILQEKGPLSFPHTEWYNLTKKEGKKEVCVYPNSEIANTA